ncbi:MAG TPA: RNA methyltransferase [Lacibacter sp.]|nr:RNA methyltransferase [Lacibacter sp.]HMO89635.1 RNA methyltransferase [Lacibacter sp.]HMP86631.1 RNA methyltransferase [Lacibacter sp.]
MLTKNEVKHIQSLHHKKGREESDCFLVEGVKITRELLAECPQQLVALYALPEFFREQALTPTGDRFREISPAELERISALQTPQQVVCVVRRLVQPQLLSPENNWILVLDGIRDPGNMGTILRLADWFGIRQVVASPDSVDGCNPKVVQASMGSVLRVPVIVQELDGYCRQSHGPVVAAVLNGTPVQDYVFPDGGLLLIGNEAQGIRPGLLERVQQAVTIPSFGKAESLNAAVATGILLWELRRRGT